MAPPVEAVSSASLRANRTANIREQPAPVQARETRGGRRPASHDLTWLNLVRSCGGFDGADDGSRVVVEWGAGVQDVVAGLNGDAAVAA